MVLTLTNFWIKTTQCENTIRFIGPTRNCTMMSILPQIKTSFRMKLTFSLVSKIVIFGTQKIHTQAYRSREVTSDFKNKDGSKH